MPKFTTSDGLSLYYEDDGQGFPILCLAGLTRTTRDFDYVTPHLTGNRLIKIDIRGRGQSDFAKDWKTYALPIESRDVLELLDHLKVEAAAILGTSRGGLIAMGLALAHPDRVLGACFNDVGPVVDPKGLEPIISYLGKQPAAKTHAEAAAAMKQNVTGFANVPDSRWMEEATKHYTQTTNGLAITYDPKLRNAIEVTATQPVPDLWPFFDALAGKPTACIRGANSLILTPETLAEMQRRRPDMHVATVPDRGHIPFLDEPEAVTTLHAWLKDFQ